MHWTNIINDIYFRQKKTIATIAKPMPEQIHQITEYGTKMHLESDGTTVIFVKNRSWENSNCLMIFWERSLISNDCPTSFQYCKGLTADAADPTRIVRTTCLDSNSDADSNSGDLPPLGGGWIATQRWKSPWVGKVVPLDFCHQRWFSSLPGSIPPPALARSNSEHHRW